MNLGSVRVALRLGGIAARRGRWRSALVGLLICLPVMAMVAGATIMQAVTPTPERLATARMGAADLLVTPSGSSSTADQLARLLPRGSTIEPITQKSDRLNAAGAEYGVRVEALDLDGLAVGMLNLLSGRAPTVAGEVAVSPGIAQLSRVAIGDRLTLDGLGAVTITGIVEDPMNLKIRVVLVAGSLASGLVDLGDLGYLVRLPAGVTAADLPRQIAVEAVGAQDTPLFWANTRDLAGVPSESQAGTIFVLGGLALVEAALVALAAFAVGIRRRQRELGLLGAVGAEPRHLAAMVIAEALLLGTAGAAVGVVAGLAVAAASGPWLDQLTDRRNAPAALSVGWLVAAAGIGLAAALIAALIPARTAANVPILAALSGRRPVTAPARRTLVLGVATIFVALVATLAGAGRSSDPRLLLAGAVLGVLGFGACSPWLLERLEGLAPRLPLSPRLALRDTSRFRSRNGPIVTAVLAGFAATVAIAALLSSQEAAAASFYSPGLHRDQLLVVGTGAATAGAKVAADLGAVASAPVRMAVTTDGRGRWLGVDGTDINAHIAVGDEDLLRVMGGEEALGEFRDGAVVLFLPGRAPAGPGSIHDEPDQAGGGMDVIATVPIRTITTPATYELLPDGVMSVATARSLGLVAAAGEQYQGRYLVRLPHPVADADIQRAGDIASGYPDTTVNWETGQQRPGEAFRLLLLVASLVFALSVTGVAVALGEAEARPDQRTLLALGADPSVRRRITAARAGVLAGIAGVLAVPAGLLPVWGLLVSRHLPLVVPIPEVIAALAILPLAAIIGAAVLSRPIPRWSTYRGDPA